MKFRFLKQIQRFISLIAIGFLVLAIIVARHQLAHYHIPRIRDLIYSIPPFLIGQALLLTAGSYLVTTAYDRLAIHYIGKKMALVKIMFASFISFAVSHNTGHPLISGTSLRYRFYPGWGISGYDIIKITLFDSITYGLGLCTLLLVFFVESAPLPIPHLPFIVALFAIAYAIYWFCVARWRSPITIKGVPCRLPSGKITLVQIMVGSADVFLAGMVLYTLLSPTLDIPLGEFFIIYILSLVLGNFSQVPGGIGIFEGLFLHLLSYHYPDADALTSLVLYRLIYYCLPLVLAGGLLLVYELKSRRLCLRWRIFRRTYRHYG